MRLKNHYANKNNSPIRVRHGTKAVGCAVALLMAVWALHSKDAVSMDLTRFEWKNRLLFIFAPDGKHPPYKRVHAEINNQPAEVNDRDLVVFEIFEKDPSRMNGSPLSQPDADALRERFEIPPKTFVLVLVGKDGGVKLKRDERVSLSEIFGLIDAMPMRRDEMRQKNQ